MRRDIEIQMHYELNETEEAAFDAMCERVAMRILGKRKDPSPGVNWHCNRSWKVEHFRALVREALAAERQL